MNPIHLEHNDKDGNDSFDDMLLQQYHDKPIVHGMLLSSLFSCIFGSLIPGSVYRKQTLYFHKPVFTGELVIGQVTVLNVKQMRIRRSNDNEGSQTKNLGGVLVTCDTQILKELEITLDSSKNKIHNSQHDGDKEVNLIKCVTGQAEVWLPGVQSS